MYTRILVGTDFSDTAECATERAGWLAQKLGGELYIVHAGSDRAGRMDAVAEKYRGKGIVREGNPADVLISAADEIGADLLVVGSVGMSGPRRFLLGNVPNKVSHHSRKDLLIVKTDKPRVVDAEGYSTVLVGSDGSDTSMQAVEAAAQLSAQLGLGMTVVCAYEPLSEHELEQLRADPNDPIAQWSAIPGQDIPDEFRWRISAASHAEDILERAQEHAAKHGVEVETRALEGHPAEQIITFAEEQDFDLIVLGNVGMSGAKRFMLGNVPHRISHHAPTDVLVVRTS